MNENQNVYFKARKNASKCNERLCSREGASELLGVSVSTLADYELGNTKVVPVDKVVLMADLYNCPELKNGYCKHECPIGKDLPLATKVDGIEGIALRMIRELDLDGLEEMKKKIIEISSDGKISKDEISILEKLMEKLNDLSVAASEFCLAGKKILGGNV